MEKDYNMTIDTLSTLINGKTVSFNTNDAVYEFCFASDLMSDVLCIDEDRMILVTGLANMQSIRTAEMADITCIVLARGKNATAEMTDLANESDITIIESPYSMFRISGLLYQNNIKPLF